jgi:hypothetical protein
MFKVETRPDIPEALNHEMIMSYPFPMKFPHPHELPEDIGKHPPMEIMNPPLCLSAIGTVGKRHREEPANVHAEELNKGLDILGGRPCPLPLRRRSVAVMCI